jgi:hypothetical protein
MPKSIEKPSSEVRCTDCDKLLATPQGIKCPRCKKVHSFEECFAEALRPDQYIVVHLWRPDGSIAMSITIRKEIWINLGSRPEVPKGKLQYPVFFVYNYLDSTQAFAADAGCRVNKEPIFDFRAALSLAKQHELAARNSGKWVEVKDVSRLEKKVNN